MKIVQLTFDEVKEQIFQSDHPEQLFVITGIKNKHCDHIGGFTYRSKSCVCRAINELKELSEADNTAFVRIEP